MFIAHEKLHGLNRDQVVKAIEPVLTAHGVECVELIWRTDQGGWMLELTVERPADTEAGRAVTIDLCSEISRDLSAALDVADCIPGAYRLEVGSPGVERALYLPSDYSRFAGRLAKIKTTEPIQGQAVIRARLAGLDAEGRVALSSERGEALAVDFKKIQAARLLFEWDKGSAAPKKAAKAAQPNPNRPHLGSKVQRRR